MIVGRLTHGVSAYKHGLCRCDRCRREATAVARADRARRAAALAADPSLRPHGNIYTYSNWCCRCDECCAVKSVQNKAYQDKRSGRETRSGS